LWHYIEECEETVDWFRDLEGNKEEIWKKWSEDLDERKGEILVKMEGKGKDSEEKKK